MELVKGFDPRLPHPDNAKIDYQCAVADMRDLGKLLRNNVLRGVAEEYHHGNLRISVGSDDVISIVGADQKHIPVGLRIWRYEMLLELPDLRSGISHQIEISLEHNNFDPREKDITPGSRWNRFVMAKRTPASLESKARDFRQATQRVLEAFPQDCDDQQAESLLRLVSR